MNRHPKFRVVVYSSVGPCYTYKSTFVSCTNFISKLIQECYLSSFSSSLSYVIQRYDTKLDCYLNILSSSVNFNSL